MEEELSTDAIGIRPRSEPEHESRNDDTCIRPNASESEITVRTHETGCPQTNNQSQSKTLVKTFQSENSNAIWNDNNLVSSDDLLNQNDDRSQNERNARELGHDHPTLSEESEINSESIESNMKPPEDVKQTHDINALDQALSNLKLPPEHLGTHETGCPPTNIQSQSETLEKPLPSENTNAIGNEKDMDSNQDDRRSNNPTEFVHDHPRISKEFEVNAESTVPIMIPLEKVKQTHDKNVLNQASSNLTLPPEPPLEWRLNELLDDIALQIDGDDFKRIKLMFTGPESLGKNLLNECDTCIKLLTVLKQRKYISRDNILYLNRILYILGRRDLIKRCVRYCSEEGNVIHYYSYDGEPGSGTRYVKIHVVADVQNYNKETLDQLRYYVARLVCAPIEVILISAVEPGSSFLITLSMPDTYVDVLKDLLQENVNLWKLSSLQVDIIIVDDVHYDVSGHSGARMVTEQYIKIKNVYEQLNDTRKQLEQLEITHLQCTEELENLYTQLKSTEKQNGELTTTCSMLQKMHLTFSVTDTALDGFRSLMKEASNKGQEMGLIQKIIKSSTEITAAYHRRLHEMEREGQNLKIKERKLRENMLLQELLSKQKSAEEILHTKYSQHTLDTNITLNLNSTKSLYDISKTLKDEDRGKLIYTVTWSKNDLVKACIEADNGLLLLGLECKQAEQEQNKISTGTFLTKLGEKIGKDLLKMHNQIVEHKRKEGEEEKRKELNLQLLKRLTLKSKSTEEIVLSYAESFSFKCIIKSEEKSQTVPATFFVKQMIQKSKGLILFLNEDECSKMLSTYTWYEQDVIKECIKEDRRLLFPGLLCKEMEMLGKVIHPDELIKRIQEHAKRTDLLGLSNQVKADEKEQQLQIERWLERKTKEPQLPKMLSSGQSSAGEVLLLKLKKYTLKLADDIETKHFEKIAQLLGDLSEDLSKKEQSELIDLYEWEENDIIKACIAADEKLLLEGLWCKEMDITQIMPTIETFLSSICLKINREDIVDQFRANIEIQMFDDKVLRHVFSRAADFCVPIMENMFEKLLPVKNATESPPFRTESTNAYYVQLFAGNNPYADLLPD